MRIQNTKKSSRLPPITQRLSICLQIILGFVITLDIELADMEAARYLNIKYKNADILFTAVLLYLRKCVEQPAAEKGHVPLVKGYANEVSDREFSYAFCIHLSVLLII